MTIKSFEFIVHPISWIRRFRQMFPFNSKLVIYLFLNFKQILAPYMIQGVIEHSHHTIFMLKLAKHKHEFDT